jgi:hypothetical protein
MRVMLVDPSSKPARGDTVVATDHEIVRLRFEGKLRNSVLEEDELGERKLRRKPDEIVDDPAGLVFSCGSRNFARLDRPLGPF